MKVKPNGYKLLLMLIQIFIPINLLKDLFPFPITLITGGLILALMCQILLRNLNRTKFIVMVVPIALSVINIFFTDDIMMHIRYFINWYSLLCVLLLCMDSRMIESFAKEYQTCKKKMHAGMICIALLYCILLMSPSAYSGGWWGLSNGFVAYTVSHAVAASACAFALFVILFLIMNQKLWMELLGLLFLLLAVFVVFQTGARAYVISIGAIGLLFLFEIVQKKSLRIGILLAGIVFICIIWSKSAFVEKMAIVSSYQQLYSVSFINAITSGRTAIWWIDLTHFLHMDLFRWIYGGGFALSYYLNRIYYGGYNIFSHNIFLETFLSLGIVGETILIYCMYKLFKNTKTSRIGKISLFIYAPMVGFLNGLFDSQLYCYSILIICIGLRLIYDKKLNTQISNQPVNLSHNKRMFHDIIANIN